MRGDHLRNEILKLLGRPLPPITLPEERALLSDYVEHLGRLADQLPVDSSLRLGFRQHALAVQDRIDEYDARQDDA